MKAIPLTAQNRDVLGKKVKKLRWGGLIPATIYGKDIKSESLAIALKDFQTVYRQVGETGLVDLKFGNTSKPTLIADVQTHPVTRQPVHVQFHAVKLTEKIKANVPLELVGESSAVQSNVGLLLQTLDEIEVEALPTNLPDKITIDTSNLSEVGQQVTVGELVIPKEVEVLTNKEEIVVKVAPAVSEEAKKEAEAAEAAAQAAAEAAAEGEAPAEGAAETPVAEEAPTEPEKKE